MKTTVCGRRENKWGNGLEVPFNYLLKGPDKYFEKAECTLKRYCWKRKDYLMKSKVFISSMSLAYKPSGPIPGYKPMGFYAG